MARNRNKSVLTPWWSPVIFVLILSHFVAVAHTFVVYREGPFLEEWRNSVVIAASSSFGWGL